MMKSRLLLWLMLPCVILASCTAYRDVEFKGVKRTQFTGFNSSGVSCEFDVELFNPNPYKISLVSSDVDLFMEGTRLGHLSLPTSSVLLPEEKTILKLTCTAEAESIPKILSGAIGLVFKKEVVIEGKGSVTAKAFMISKVVPVEFTQRLKKEDLGL